jgi:predicted transcriptional regulator of viral defense system
MTELSAFPAKGWPEKRTVRAAAVAGAQWGVIGARQLMDCGISGRTARRWRAEGKLHPLHRGVYALGHPSIPVEGRLVAALLSVGPEAVLSHATAAWWWGLTLTEPFRIHVSSPGRARSTPAICIHHPRHHERTRLRRFPITPVPRTLLDFASHSSLSEVRRALAEADYKGLLNVEELKAVLTRGRPGAGKLRRALKTHEPRLALTRSAPERRFLALCERAGIPTPEVNARVGRMTVDALWRPERLVVEVDTYGTHGSPQRMERDRRRELHLRAAGYRVVRYTDVQINQQPELVAADLSQQLGPTARSA